MIKYVQHSSQIIGKHLFFVLLLAFTELNIYAGTHFLVPALQVVALIVSYPLCFKRLFESALDQQQTDQKSSLITFTRNYWIVLLTALVMMTAISGTLSITQQSLKVIVTQFALPLAFNILLIYIIPIIFIKSIHLKAVPTGLKCLFKDIKKTTFLVCLMSLSMLFKFLPVVIVYGIFLWDIPIHNAFVVDLFNYLALACGIFIHLTVILTAMFILSKDYDLA